MEGLKALVGFSLANKARKYRL